MTMCCCSVDNDWDTPIYNKKEMKARKNHKCYECKDTIEKGKIYFRIKSLSEGEWWNFPICKTCNSIIIDFLCGSHPFGGVYNAFWDCMGFYPDEIPDNEEE